MRPRRFEPIQEPTPLSPQAGRGAGREGSSDGLFLLVGTALILTSAAPVARAAEKKAGPPNIIFLLTDDQRWDTLGCMGNPIIRTPNIDRLAEQGVVFENCFVTTSICMTNRACIFTGQYAARHGIWDFRTSFTPGQLADTYVGRLKRAGYHLGFIGKWGVGKPPEALFDFNRAWPGQNRYLHKDGQRLSHLTTIMGRQALDFLADLPADRPFCLSFSFKSPHCQDGNPERFPEEWKQAYGRFPGQFLYDPKLERLYQDVTIPPPPLGRPEFFAALPAFLRESENRVRWNIRFSTPEKYQESVKSYYRLITGVDRVVGDIVAELKERGLAENTVIMLTGDNGFYLGERGFAGKWYPHEVSIHVPLVVYDPRLPAEQRDTRRARIVLSIDVAPTLLALAGVDVPERMQGESLLPLVRGEEPEWRTEFFCEHLFRHPRIPRTEGVRTEQTKYIRFLDVDPPYEELYDLRADPDEAHNLAGRPDQAKLLDEMRAKWRAWRKRAK